MAIQPARLDLRAGRFVPFYYDIAFVGYDLNTPLTYMRAQIRQKPDTPGEPIVDLERQATGAVQGLFPMGLTTIDGLPATVVRLFIDQLQMRALPFPAELGNNLDLAWDMQIQTDQTLKAVWLAGKFTVVAGVTQA